MHRRIIASGDTTLTTTRAPVKPDGTHLCSGAEDPGNRRVARVHFTREG